MGPVGVPLGWCMTSLGVIYKTISDSNDITGYSLWSNAQEGSSALHWDGGGRKSPDLHCTALRPAETLLSSKERATHNLSIKANLVCGRRKATILQKQATRYAISYFHLRHFQKHYFSLITE